MIWIIKGHEGATELFEFRAAGDTPEGEIAATLQRLACQGMSHAQILTASLPHAPAHRLGALDITREDSGHGRTLSTIGDRYYTAWHAPDPVQADAPSDGMPTSL